LNPKKEISMFFDSWNNLANVVIGGTLVYVGAVILLRISGNRTMSKMNSFDLVVTIAFGSTLSSTLISSDVSLAKGGAALALLVLLQFVITWLARRSPAFRTLVTTRPTLLVEHGRFQQRAMTAVRVTEDEVHGALRQHGLGALALAAAVVLETDGSLSVVPESASGGLDALGGVRRIKKE
jgi:uncharacterized membrane protein YcaP (DUF421 family)